MKEANYMFIVQGEGRGHMTQAISAYNMLLKAGHKVSCVIIGINPHREIPEFVKQQIKTEIVAVACPGFVMDSKLKSVKLIPSVLQTLVQLPLYRRSLKTIHKKIEEHNPKTIINFYNPLGGIYNFLFRPKIPLVCIAHQYIYLHPDYIFPEGKSMDKFAIKFYTRLTSYKAQKKLALSFYPIADYPKESVVASPPLLRKEVFNLETSESDFLLVYFVNSGYADDIKKWHKQNPGVVMHCFSDNKELAKQSENNLHFHALDDQKFLQFMSHCKGLVSTAGFESICEAKYLGKPVFMVPVEGNYEQFCNAHDACKTGTGLRDTVFNIDRFMAYLPEHPKNNVDYKKWVDSAEVKLLEELEKVV